jgi:hypothetical protein
MFLNGAARSVAFLCCLCVAAAAGTGYVNDFSKAEVGKPPADAQIAGGAFVVAEREGNKLLELPGEPLDTFGLLYGPAQPAEATASARIQGESTARRFPEFGVGVGDIGGYRLMLLPGQKTLQIRKGEDPVANAAMPPQWTSGGWTVLKIQIRKLDNGRWNVQGEAWPADQPEPTVPAVSADLIDPPPAGRASVWAVPFSGKPIRFDDLTAG